MTTGRINQVAAETRTAACVQPAPRATVRSPQDAATACNRVCVDPSNLVLGFDVRVCLSDCYLPSAAPTLIGRSGIGPSRAVPRVRAVCFCSPSEFPLCGFGIYKTSDGHRNNVFHSRARSFNRDHRKKFLPVVYVYRELFEAPARTLSRVVRPGACYFASALSSLLIGPPTALFAAAGFPPPPRTVRYQTSSRGHDRRRVRGHDACRIAIGESRKPRTKAGYRFCGHTDVARKTTATAPTRRSVLDIRSLAPT